MRIEGTWLETCIAQLYDELKARNISFLPRCYLADEWLTPENEPVIGIPFYLAHPRLIELQKKMMLEAEAAKSTAKQFLRMENAAINLGVMCTIGPLRFAAFLADFRASYPRWDVTLVEGVPSRIANC